MKEIVLNDVVMRMRLLRSIHEIAASNKENTAIAAIDELVVLNHRIRNVISEENVVIAIVSEDVIADVDILRAIHKDAATTMKSPVTS